MIRSGLHRPAIIDAHDYALIVTQIDNPHQGAERQSFMRRGEFVVIEGFAASGAASLKGRVVESRQAGLLNRQRLGGFPDLFDRRRGGAGVRLGCRMPNW